MVREGESELMSDRVEWRKEKERNSLHQTQIKLRKEQGENDDISKMGMMYTYGWYDWLTILNHDHAEN